MRIRNMAIYFTAGVLWFPQQSISTLDLVLNLFVSTPPAAAWKGVFGDTPNPGKGLRPLHSRSARERGFRGHPEPRQRASPSALPFCTRKKFSRTPRTPAKGFALCTPVLHERKDFKDIPNPDKGLRAGSHRPYALCTPYSSGFDVASSKWAWRNRVNISCLSVRKSAVLAFGLAL